MGTYYAKLTAGPEGGYGIQFPGIPSHIKPEGGQRDPPNGAGRAPRGQHRGVCSIIVDMDQAAAAAGDYLSLYRRAFEQYGVRALWN